MWDAENGLKSWQESGRLSFSYFSSDNAKEYMRKAEEQTAASKLAASETVRTVRLGMLLKEVQGSRRQCNELAALSHWLTISKMPTRPPAGSERGAVCLPQRPACHPVSTGGSRGSREGLRRVSADMLSPKQTTTGGPGRS